MKSIIDTILFFVSKLREIYSYLFAKKNKEVAKKQEEAVKKEEKTVAEEVSNKKISDLNNELGWKD